MTAVLAHVLDEHADAPVSPVLIALSAAGVLVACFVALAARWTRPRLERPGWKPLPGGALAGSRAVEVVCGAIGVALLAVVGGGGGAGEQGRESNLAPTFVYVIFWVGLAFASLLLSDVFRALNPWRAVGRAVGAVAGERGPRRPYPERLGRWPAVAGLLAFAWTDLVAHYEDLPERIATAAVVYSAVTWLGMARYGTEAWATRGEAFGVYFNAFARLSAFETRDGVLGRRAPLAGLARLEPLPGTVALVAVMIGAVAFDGLAQGPAWREDLSVWLFDAFSAAGASDTLATDLAGTVGLLGCVAVVGGLYRLGIGAARSGAFVHALVPVALAYVVAHHLSTLLEQGQAIVYLASDPLGRGWDLFGTGDGGITPDVLSPGAIWSVQVGAVALGHLAGLVLAHDRALVLAADARSRYAMLAILVGTSSLALWLLSQAGG